MKRERFRIAIAAAAAITQLGCSLLTDPAVRLANCTRQSSPANLTLLCDPGVAGEYVAVFHPRGDLSARELVSAGVPEESIPSLRQLRLGSNAAIYVIPDSSSARPSGTTSQTRYVRLPKPLAVRVPPRHILELSLVAHGDEVAIVAARAVPR